MVAIAFGATKDDETCSNGSDNTVPVATLQGGEVVVSSDDDMKDVEIAQVLDVVDVVMAEPADIKRNSQVSTEVV